MANMLNANEVRPWLASALDATAEWRQTKADEYSEDPRNLHCAEALKSASLYVQQTGSSIGLDVIAKLADSCSRQDAPLTQPMMWPGQGSQQTAARYFFDDPSDPTDKDHEQLLSRLYGAMVEDVREWDHVESDSVDKILGTLGIRPRPRLVALTASASPADDDDRVPAVVAALEPFIDDPSVAHNHHAVDYALRDLVDSAHGHDAGVLIRAVARLDEQARSALMVGVGLDERQRRLLIELETKGLV